LLLLNKDTKLCPRWLCNLPDINMRLFLSLLSTKLDDHPTGEVGRERGKICLRGGC
jgi:hypothetical protein